MNGAGLTPGSVARSGVGWGGRIMGAEAGVHNKLAEVWGFAESDRGRFDDEVLGGWIRGEDVEAFSKDPVESVEARIISSCEGKVMGVPPTPLSATSGMSCPTFLTLNFPPPSPDNPISQNLKNQLSAPSARTQTSLFSLPIRATL